MKLSDYRKSAVQHVVIYGPPKSGKTAIVGKLAEAGFKLVWFDLEKGATTLLHHVAQQFQDNIELIPLPDTRDYPIAAETMLKVFKGSLVEICETHGKVGCALCKTQQLPQIKVELNKLTTREIVVIDSVTQLSNSVMAHICRGQGDDFKPGWDEYRKQGFLLDKMFSIVQQAPYNIIAITHENMVEMEDKKQRITPTAGTRNFSATFGKYFDHVVYSEISNKKHRFFSSTTALASVLTGSRSDIEVEKKEVPTLLDIFRPLLAPTLVKESK